MIRLLLDRWRTRRCPHARLEGIYGDPINHCGGYRLRCADCGRLLDGPVSLATEPTTPPFRHEAPCDLSGCASAHPAEHRRPKEVARHDGRAHLDAGDPGVKAIVSGCPACVTRPGGAR